MTPQEDASISRLMQHVGRLYVLYVNKGYRRSGTLFEGRHKASLVAADDCLVTCHRDIELNPVGAGRVHKAPSSIAGLPTITMPGAKPTA